MTAGPASRLSLTGLLVMVSGASAQTYENPLPVLSDLHGPVETCADPAVAPDGDAWVMLCTTDPLNADDRDANGDLVFRLLPTFTSPDLVHWTYAGDAFDRDPATPTPAPPAWAEPDAALWAPDIARLGDAWLLTYAVTAVTDAGGGEPSCDEDSAIGHAIGPTPLGPWTAADAPLVAPRRTGPGCEFLWTLDPEVFDGGRALAFGSFHGGIHARRLIVADGAVEAPEGTEVPLTVAGRYEGAEIVAHDGWSYLFASAANCCAGPQTGYGVFVARSRDPLGPYVDADGHALLDARVGGTPVLMQSGNAWVGPGHNTVVEDAGGQWWSLHHAVEEADPYLAGEPGFTRRPVLLDRLDWVGGWPLIAGGAGPSDAPRPAPGAALGAPAAAPPDAPGAALMADGFDGPALDLRWSPLREPSATVGDGVLRVATHPGDLHEDSNDAPILLADAPDGDYVVEARLRLDLPPACCEGYPQAGLVLHGTDDAYLKLVVVAIGGTRQTEFAREVPDPVPGAPRYGNAVGGPPGEWTDLRLVVRRDGAREAVTAWTRAEGGAWRRGATWTHALGPHRIGLVAMGGAGHEALFDAVTISSLAP